MIRRLALVLALCAWASCGAAEESAPLTWAPPLLENPQTIEIAKVIQERATWGSPAHVKLELDKDYIIKMPPEPLTTKGGLGISGGRNVVLIGGEIRFEDISPEESTALERRAVYINRATGTVHIEGLLITGQSPAEGFNVDLREPNAILQIQNVRVENLRGTREGHHADVVQTWAGPAELRIDRLTGTSDYQGCFLAPFQHFKEAEVKQFEFRRMNLKTGGYVYWQLGTFPIVLEDVWADSVELERKWPELMLWPKGDPVWKDVKKGSPPGGDFVPAGVAGLNYKSPGYLAPPSPAPASAEQPAR